MCGFCNGNDTMISNYCDLSLSKQPFVGYALVVNDVRKSCPKFSDCCVKDMKINAVFDIKYCPVCGEKLKGEKDV